jgi:transcriptional regulator with XRE-family HTH domain
MMDLMAEDIRIRFGRKLQKLRKQRGWTQVQMAEQLGLDRSYLSDVERGKRNISIVNLEVIARGFGLTLSRLLIKV